MSIAQLLTLPCTVTRRTASVARDEYGNQLDTVTSTDTVCEIQQQQRQETTVMGDVIDDRWLVVLPAGTTVDAGDRVTAGGVAYEVHGTPWEVRNPLTGTVSHIEGTLRRTGGVG